MITHIYNNNNNNTTLHTMLTQTHSHCRASSRSRHLTAAEARPRTSLPLSVAHQQLPCSERQVTTHDTARTWHLLQRLRDPERSSISDASRRSPAHTVIEHTTTKTAAIHTQRTKASSIIVIHIISVSTPHQQTLLLIMHIASAARPTFTSSKASQVAKTLPFGPACLSSRSAFRRRPPRPWKPPLNRSTSKWRVGTVPWQPASPWTHCLLGPPTRDWSVPLQPDARLVEGLVAPAASVVEVIVAPLLAKWWPPSQKLSLLWSVVIMEPEQQHQPITSSHKPSTYRALPRNAG
ncbi:hypothetical protein WHR41_09256 [Cladosporium halotolerans]|uniref:Uncharacterized protein n=1 Tax=Cladosporium halotolerans TaxID=1052096 RepID=A0AB34KBZ9_9PEZI